MTVLCIYHANCVDGLGAAWATYRALPDVEFVAAKYGDPPPARTVAIDGRGMRATNEVTLDCSAFAGRDVLIVDFSYPLPTLRAMAREARSVLVLDHHKTAREDLAEIRKIGISWKDWQDSHNRSTVYSHNNLAAIFDMERSGAGLTWDYLSVGKPRPRIIDLIEDRDLWRFRFGVETREFHAVLASYDWTDLDKIFWLLDWWNEKPLDLQAAIREGSAILRANAQAVTTAVAASRRTIKIAGHVVPCANVPGSMASDAGHLLCMDVTLKAFNHSNNENYDSEMVLAHSFSATYYNGADGRRHFSLRSPEGGADVGQIARQMAEKLSRTGYDFTGGGHSHAAGFDAPIGWEGE